MVFIFTKTWEFEADDYESARKTSDNINPTEPPLGVIETEESLVISEESLESHWNKYAAH